LKVLVTGLTGSLGKTLLPVLLEEGNRVIGYSRCEFRQSQMEKHPCLTQYMG
jgi:FlaA1/EpsC-like NDP-sugar epimerase